MKRKDLNYIFTRNRVFLGIADAERTGEFHSTHSFRDDFRHAG